MKEKTIFALGFFDGVHLGHQALLSCCRALAEENGCKAGVVTFLGHPDTLVKGKTPLLINTPEDRKKLLEERFYMDTVVELPFDREMMAMPWRQFIELLQKEHGAVGFVCGHDFRFGNRGMGTADLLATFCLEQKIPCQVVPEQKIREITISSSHIRTLLEEGQMAEAVRFLGHPHVLTGTVVSGRRLGRTLGIPTANLLIPDEVAQLRYGVYICQALVEDRLYPAVTNVGNRPTVGGHRVTVEPWILGFDGDLYGKSITLFFHEFLRPEKKFDSLEDLREEIQKNAVQTRKFFEKT